jgi:DNA-binding NarL/FixJ family response regulator
MHSDLAMSAAGRGEANVFHRGWFQVVVRDARLNDAVREVLMLYSTARLAGAESGWPELGQAQRFAGIIAEYGPGFEAWAAKLRREAPSMPILVLTPLLEASLLSRLQARNIELATLPLHAPQLVAFVQRALVSDYLPHDRVARLVAHLAKERALTPREVQLVSFCLGNETRARVRRRLGVSENTLKTQIRGLLRKCGERNVDALAKNLLRAALLADRPQQHVEPIAPWCAALPGAA